MTLPDASLLALMGIGSILLFGAWKMGVAAFHARRATESRTPA